jgi:actin-related protein
VAGIKFHLVPPIVSLSITAKCFRQSAAESSSRSKIQNGQIVNWDIFQRLQRLELLERLELIERLN